MPTKAKVETVVIDRGEKEFMIQLEKIKGSFVDIGIFGGMKRSAGDEVSIAEYALFNELGTESIHERSFIRSTVDKNKSRYKKIIREGLTDIVLGHTTAKRVLTELGIIIQGDIKKTITELRTPANAPSTIKTKKSSNPLIDTGTMRNAIQKRVTI